MHASHHEYEQKELELYSGTFPSDAHSSQADPLNQQHWHLLQ
jgi:hypothetical protein